MPSVPQPPRADLRLDDGYLRQLTLLMENEIDLQVELNDLADEIATRVARIVTVRHLQRENARALARLVGRPW